MVVHLCLLWASIVNCSDTLEGGAMVNAEPAVPTGSSATGIPNLIIFLGVFLNAIIPCYILVALLLLDVGTIDTTTVWSNVLVWILENQNQLAAKLAQSGIGGAAIGVVLQATLFSGRGLADSKVAMIGLSLVVVTIFVAIYVYFALAPDGLLYRKLAEVKYDGSELPGLVKPARAAVSQTIEAMVAATMGAFGLSKFRANS